VAIITPSLVPRRDVASSRDFASIGLLITPRDSRIPFVLLLEVIRAARSNFEYLNNVYDGEKAEACD
jgi:hypothetical protein